MEYFATSVATIASLLLSWIVVLQNEKIQDHQEEKEIEDRHNEIRPNISIEVIKKGEICELILKNNSKYSASNIYLFDAAIMGLIKGNERKIVKFTWKEINSMAVFLSDYYIQENEKGFPEKILLQCYDIDHNLLVLNYVISDIGEEYYLSEHSYE